MKQDLLWLRNATFTSGISSGKTNQRVGSFAIRVALIGCFVLLLSVHVKAQRTGEVQILRDSLIDMMQELRSGSNIYVSRNTTSTTPKVVDRKNATRTTARGFRVQIYSGSSRSDAYAAQARFKRLYKDIDSYVTYQEPNYRVKVGDFRGRGDANSLMQSLRPHFSNVFIFQEDIYVYQ